jgi:hypothetical protein
MRLLAAWMFCLASLALSPVPRAPDAAFHPLDRVAAFLMFCSWALAVVSWGRVIATLARDRAASLVRWMAYGTLGAALSAAALGLPGLIGPGKWWLFLALMLLGPILDFFIRRPGPRFSLSEACFGGEGRTFPGYVNFALLAAITLEIGTRVWGASIPRFHSDPMFYHLLGPKLWFDSGAIRFLPLHPQTAHCGYWELLALWANELVASANGAGLLNSLLFMQWASAIFGYAATALAMNRILTILPTPTPWRRLAIFAGLSTGMLGWTAWLAKNDWGLVFWVLAGVCVLLESPRKPRRDLVLGGLLIGLAVANKFTLGFSVLPLLLALAWSARWRGEAAWVAAGLGAAVLPVLFHHWVYLDNPVFPALNAFFNSPWLTESMRMRTSASLVSPQFGFSMASVSRLWLLFVRDTPLLIGAAIPLIALLPPLRRRVALAPLDLVPILAIAVVFMFVGYPSVRDDGTMHLRWLGFIFVLGPALGFRVLHQWLKQRRASPAAEWILIAVLFGVAASRFPDPIPSEYFSPPVALTMTAAGGEAKRWLRLNADPKDLIFTTGDSHLYPVAHLNVVDMTSVPYLDWIASHVRDPRAFVAALKELKVKYLLDSMTARNGRWNVAAYTFDAATFAHPEAVVFAGQRSSIVDVDRLYDNLLLSCARLSDE